MTGPVDEDRWLPAEFLASCIVTPDEPDKDDVPTLAPEDTSTADDNLIDVLQQLIRFQLGALETHLASMAEQVQLFTQLEARLAGLSRGTTQQEANNGWPTGELAPQPGEPPSLIPRQASKAVPQLTTEAGSTVEPIPEVTAKPASAPTPEAWPVHADEPGTTAATSNPPEASPSSSGPEWQQPPMILDNPSMLDLMLQLRTQVTEGRRATLKPPLSVVSLRPHLPMGLGVQPKEDGLETREVLFYRYQGAMAPEVYLRLGHRLVDLLSCLAPDGILQPDLHAKLTQAIKERRLPIEPRAGEHIEARARWRRFVAVEHKQLTKLVHRSEYAFRSQLSHCLVLVTREDPRFIDRVGRLFNAAQLPVPIAAWLDGALLTRQIPAPALAVTPGHAPAPAPVPVPGQDFGPVQTPDFTLPPAQEPASPSRPFDPVLINKTRVDTARVHEVLQALDENADPQDPGAEERLPSVAEPEPGPRLDGPVRQLAAFLSHSEKHALADVRIKATALGIAPLEAVRLINEWAEAHMTFLNEDFDTLVEVDNEGDAVWVEPLLKELLQ